MSQAQHSAAGSAVPSSSHGSGGLGVSQSLLDALVDPSFVLSAAGVILAANRAAVELLAPVGGELPGRGLEALMGGVSRPVLREALEACFGSGTSQRCTVLLTPPAGPPREMDLSLALFTPTDGLAGSLCLALARDVSAERQRDIDLLRFSNVAHLTLNPLEITDVGGGIIYVNPAFERASGYSKEELLGKNPRVFGSGKHSRAFWEGMWNTIRAGKVWVGEVENRRRNGEPFHTFLLISPVVDHEGKIIGYFGIHRDITEQKALEHQLFQAQKMESIGTLAAGIAHEVGNPLTSISSLVQVVQRTTQDDFAKEKLELIKHQVMRISKIIRDLVDFSRPSTYGVQLTDVNKCIRQAVEIVRVGKKSKGIQFDINLDPALPSLHLVPDQVEQVLINILINAVDAVFDLQQRAPQGYRGEVSVSSRHDAEHVQILIRDNGKGMSEQQVEKIFEPFFSTKGVGEGTGLGLWVSYGIVRSFHGRIRVQSSIGEGSTFTILLPSVPQSG